MTDGVRPIETVYQGYRFRSRLEARWAVFFDALGVRYEYEPEGFDLGHRAYLPDFWLPGERCYVEIKPGRPERREIEACEHLAAGARQHVVMLCGQPWPEDYQVITVISIKDGDYLPAEWGDGEPGGSHFADGTPASSGLPLPPRPALWNRGGWWQCPVCSGVRITPQYSMPELFYCETCSGVERRHWVADGERRGFVWRDGHHGFWDLRASPPEHDPARTPALMAAYTAARSARFEHGESGAPPRRGRGRLPPGGLVTAPPPAWRELVVEAGKAWFGASREVLRKMEPRWGTGFAAPSSEAEARAYLADLERFAEEAGAGGNQDSGVG